MNGERNNYWLNAGVAMAIGLVLSASIFGWFYSKTKKGEEAITVTGSAKKRIKSDLVLWTAGVSTQSPTLNEAYAQIAGSIPRIKQYLAGRGIAENQMTVSSIMTTPL
ncbi:MAG: SIMPL domain-containing protein, partial [Acidobacteria bacterium]|nr:SIMPL domain-containing protein [Acidobacteriota bacterium]